MRTQRTGLTVIEILVVVGIIALLVGMLLPAVHTVQKMAKETKQRAQFTSIELGLAAFKNDYGDYPPSRWWDPRPGVGGMQDYCGAQKLAEALLGWDMLGFHPETVWRADGLDNDGGQTTYDPPNPGIVSLEKRLDRYIELDTANTFLLGGNTDGLFVDTGTLAPRTYVLCDVFSVSGRKVVLGTSRTGVRTMASPGTPILYFKANPASKRHLPLQPDQTSLCIYDARDNAPLVNLGKVADGMNAMGARRAHPLAAGVKPGYANFEYFYDFIRDPKVLGQPWPYRPDSYLLISAGMDGSYGTADDICNFGR